MTRLLAGRYIMLVLWLHPECRQFKIDYLSESIDALATLYVVCMPYLSKFFRELWIHAFVLVDWTSKIGDILL
jgi:hypothetical protein